MNSDAGKAGYLVKQRNRDVEMVENVIFIPIRENYIYKSLLKIGLLTRFKRL